MVLVLIELRGTKLNPSSEGEKLELSFGFQKFRQYIPTVAFEE